METITDVLYYLNIFDFTANVNDTDFENLRGVKRILVKEFEVYEISKIIDLLKFDGNLIITLTVGDLQDCLDKTDNLRENVFYLISFKHFVKINVESFNHFL